MLHHSYESTKYQRTKTQRLNTRDHALFSYTAEINKSLFVFWNLK